MGNCRRRAREIITSEVTATTDDGGAQLMEDEEAPKGAATIKKGNEAEAAPPLPPPAVQTSRGAVPLAAAPVATDPGRATSRLPGHLQRHHLHSHRRRPLAELTAGRGCYTAAATVTVSGLFMRRFAGRSGKREARNASSRRRKDHIFRSMDIVLAGSASARSW